MREHKQRISRRAFLGGAAAIGAAYLANPAIAYATPTAAEKQAEADAVRAQVIEMHAELLQASDDYFAALDEYEAATAAKNAAQVRIDDTNRKIAAVQNKLGTRARSMYRSGGSSFLEILLAARSFEEFATNWDILNHMNQSDADMVEEAKDLRAQIEEEKAEFARQEAIAEEKTALAKTIKEKAEATVVELEALLETLDEEARKLLEAEQRAAAEAEAARQRAAAEAASGNGAVFTPGGTNIPSQGSVIDYAISRLGCPYVWGATGPNTFDCSGLTSWCYNQIGIWITRTTYTQYARANAILPVSSAEPGDVLYNGGHVGLATKHGGGEYIHAPQTGDVVRYSTWAQFYCALRFR
ncbi:MAG: NlpC/P60 family protein [Eggerthellaceae bacterium]|jgi:cell wall-associated NlpC family hydrolase|nr:NlpC/P60 family protein [Eggerthellaceae bacterium]